jgi:glycosyltransferase involved in cell wall biosynthesis
MRFDVVMPTLNSVSRVGRKIFEKVLQRIFTQIPVHRLIVVDDGSDDETLNVLKDFDAFIIKGVGTLGKARELGIRYVETDWFYFIDDDNLIPLRFHENMWKHVDEKVGMIYPNSVIPYNNYLIKYETIVGKLRRRLGLREVVEIRGYTGATLIRTEAVKGISIPPVPRQEDRYIKDYCEKKGWLVKYIPQITVLHFHRDLPTYKTQYLEGYGMAKVGATSHNRMLLSWLLTYPKSLIAYLYVREGQLLTEVPKMYYIKYLGYRHAEKCSAQRLI